MSDIKGNKIYGIYKRVPFKRGKLYPVDNREFTDICKCREEANKCGGMALIKKVKVETGWVNILEIGGWL